MDRRPEPASLDDGNEQRAARARIPWAADGGSRRVALIALGIGLCMVVAGVAIAVFSSPGGGQAGPVAGAGSTPAATAPAAQPTPPVPSSRAATPSSRATTRAETTSDGLAKSVLRWPRGHTGQILRWDAGPGGRALAAVGEQMGAAMQSAGLKQYAQMQLACAQLASDIGSARAEPPIPDTAMQLLYAKALAGLSRAAAHCHTAISIHIDDESTDVHLNRPLLNRSRLEFAAASAKLYRATGEIEALHR